MEIMVALMLIGLGCFYFFYTTNNIQSKKIQKIVTDEKNKGLEFEEEVAKYLEGKPVKVLRNLIIPNGKRGTTEIDLVVLSTKGFYVLECKNYSGYVMGGEDDHNWTISYKYKNYKKNISFYNPLKQNSGHVTALRKMFPKYYFQSVVLFSDNTGLSNNLFKRKDVMQLKGFKWFIENAFPKRKVTETEAVVESIYDYLKAYENKDRDAHIAYVKSFKNNIA